MSDAQHTQPHPRVFRAAGNSYCGSGIGAVRRAQSRLAEDLRIRARPVRSYTMDTTIEVLKDGGTINPASFVSNLR